MVEEEKGLLATFWRQLEGLLAVSLTPTCIVVH